jgi:hypothetical protein
VLYWLDKVFLTGDYLRVDEMGLSAEALSAQLVARVRRRLPPPLPCGGSAGSQASSRLSITVHHQARITLHALHRNV